MLLKIKEYLIGAGIVLVLAILYTLHVKNQQAEKDKAADQRVADAQLIHNQEVEDLVKERLTQTKLTPPAPPLPIPIILCHAATPSPSNLPSIQGTGQSGSGAPDIREEVSGGFDPAPAVQRDGRDADAQINHLLDYIQSLKDAGVIK